MEQRALDFIRKLNNEGWTINERMAEQFCIFARAECVRAVNEVKVQVKRAVDDANYKVQNWRYHVRRSK